MRVEAASRLDRSALGCHEARIPPALHHMAVGENQSVRGNDDARADPDGAPAGMRLDADHGGSDPIDDARDGLRIGVEQCAVRRFGEVMVESRMGILVRTEDENGTRIEHGHPTE